MAVYIVQQPKNSPGKTVYDISPCLEFGEPTFIFDSWEQPGNNPKLARLKASRKLSFFDPDEDYILWAGGDPFALALVSAMLVTLFYSYKFLRWERSKSSASTPGRYVVVTLNSIEG